MRRGLRAPGRFLCALGLGAAALARPVAAQSPAIGIQRVGPSEVAGDAGGRITVAFKVTSRASAERRVATTIDLPAAWQLVVPDSSVTVAAGGTELQLIPIAIPASVHAGAYVVKYTGVPDGEPGARAAQDSVIVTIAERRQLDAKVAQAPSFVGAGDSYRAAFLIRNTGNAPAVVRIALNGDRDIDARLDSTTLRIEPGDERTVTAAVQTSAKTPRKMMQRVGILATPVGDTVGRISVASAVEVIPRQPREASTRMGLPVLLGLAKSDAGTVAPELSGGGYLTRARTAQVDFLARPRAPGDFLAAQDEYWLGISRQDRYRLRLGDQFYNRSRLTQSVRAGAGGAGELWVGPLILGAQGMTDRRTFDLTRERQYGGTVDLRLAGDRTRIGTGFLSRSGINAGTIWLGQGVTHFLGQNVMRWEYGLGDGDRGRGQAYIASVNGGGQILSYGIQREQADTSFPGLGAGVTYSDLNLRLRATKDLALFAGAAERTGEPQGFVSLGSLYRELEGGMSFRQILGLTWRRTRDTGRTAGTARTGQSGRATLRFPVLRLANLSGTFEHGVSIFDATPGVQVPFNRGGGQVDLSIAGQRLWASIDRTKGTPLYGVFEVDQTVAQVYADIRIGGNTHLNVGFTANRAGNGAGTSSMIDIGVDQRLARGQQVRWTGQSFASPGAGPGRQSRQRAQYTIPLSAPLPGEDEAGSVQVRLVDGSGKAIANVLVRLGGDARMTDAAGRAKFAALLPGTYQMDVDRSRIGAGRIVQPALPLAIDVVRGERRTLELRFASAAQVIGVVQRLDFQPNRRLDAPDSLVDGGGQSGVRLMLTNNGDTLRTVSNGGGRFRFGDVRAGHWVLSVLPTGMPAEHRAEQARVELDVTAGETEDVPVRILPVKPNIVFIADVDLTPERPAAVPVPTPAPPKTPAFHVVASNDTSLLQVARKVYGDATLWPKIWLANRARLARPELMHVGDTLVVPAEAPLTRAEVAARDAYLSRPALPRGWPVADATWRPPVVRHYYTVTRHDLGLMGVARAMYGTSALWPKIWLANLDVLASPDAMRAGQRLRIPEAAPLTRSEVAARDAYRASRPK